ncbi:MAG: hypothetical protein IKM05_04045 [Clostridia bacterium]|nr:hypothetical protein [Clostridia bacterium]
MSVNLGRVAYVEKGDYNPNTVYEKKDVVFYDGGSYVFIGDAPVAGMIPTDGDFWQPMAVPRQSSSLIRGLCILENACGDVVCFQDGADNMPLQAAKTHIPSAAESSGWNRVSMTCAGKNLADLTEFSNTSSTVVTTAREGIVTMNGTPASSGSTTILLWKSTLKPGTYTLSHKVLSGSMTGAAAAASVLSGAGVRTRLNAPAVTFTLEEETACSFSIVRATSAVTYDHFTFSVQLEWGDTATDFEPPNIQTLSAELPEAVTEGEYDWLHGRLVKADGSTLQLEKQVLSSLKGANTIWCDAGEMEVTYVADPGLYIEQKMAALAAADNRLANGSADADEESL